MNHDLTNRLKQSRSRYRSRLLLRGLSTSLIAALAALVALLILQRLFQPLRLSAGLLWLLPLATLLIGIIRTLMQGRRGTPALERVAQLADRHFKLNERISSAIEVQARGAVSTVEAALLADAESYAGRIDPESLVHVRIPRFAWLVPALGVVAATLMLLPPPEAPLAMVTTTAPEELSAGEREQAGSNVRRVAEMVASDAEDQRDVYLAAIARSLEELGERIERGELERPAIRQELGRILDHVDNALGKDSEIYQALLEPFTDLEVSAERAAEQLSDMELQSGEEQAGSGTDQTEASLANNDHPSESSDQADIVPPDDLTAGIDEDSSRPRRIASALGVELSGHYTDVDPEMMAKLEQRRQQLLEMQAEQGQGAIPIGAAEQSSAGVGDIAGDGTQALGEDPGMDLAAFEFEQEELQLPFDEESTGRRIRIEAAPDTQLTDVNSAGAGPAGTWLRQNEAPLTQNIIGLSQRQAIIRYFLPADDSR